MTCPACRSTMAPWIEMPIDAKKDEYTPYGNVIRCSGCGLGMAAPMPEAGDVAGFYDLSAYYTHGESHMRPAPDQLLDKILVRLAWQADRAAPFEVETILDLLPQGGTVLDIGCGHGELVGQLVARGVDAIGMDPDERSRALAADSGLTVLSGTAEVPAAEVAGRRFDMVVMSHSLEHCLDPAAALATVQSLLAPGGRAYIEVPNAGCLHFETFRHCSEMFDAPRHLWFFTDRSLMHLAEATGLRVERWHYNGFTRLFSRTWRNWECEIFDRLTRRGQSRNAKRHSWLRSLSLLVRSAGAAPARKYDSIGILVTAAHSP
jgi:SAM-dependent methyltransferase